MSHNLLASWHDFYALVGTAGATLVGLMFVAASVGSGTFTEERQVALRIFLSPTVVAFSVVLATSLIAVLPAQTCVIPGALLAGAGMLGLFYSVGVWRKMVREGIAKTIDLEDRALYAAAPAVAYLLLAIAGFGCARGIQAACALLALAVSLLLVAGIRNAWDMTTWVILRRRP